MRNIPNFTTEYGAAALVLQEIPLRQEAYCLVQWAVPGNEGALLEECARFCRMAGADRVYATGLTCPGEPAFQLLGMTASKQSIPETDAALWPLLPEGFPDFHRIYNEAMATVPAARSIGEGDQARLLAQGGCYFVHRGKTLLGLGQVEENRLLSIVSCVPGQGRWVAAALLSAVQADTVELQVASTNTRALHLYRRMGFVTVGVAEEWWEI